MPTLFLSSVGSVIACVTSEFKVLYGASCDAATCFVMFSACASNWGYAVVLGLSNPSPAVMLSPIITMSFRFALYCISSYNFVASFTVFACSLFAVRLFVH